MVVGYHDDGGFVTRLSRSEGAVVVMINEMGGSDSGGVA